MRVSPTRFSFPVLLALFFVSGTAALGYQVAWTRMFSNGLGHDFRAILAVLTAIFSGFCVGSWFSDALLKASGRAGRCYGYLELTIGLWALVSLPLIPRVSDAALHWAGLGSSAVAQWSIDFAFPCLTLLPATCAMGATFAAMEAFVRPLKQRGPFIGALYAANTFGAVLGTLLGASPLFPTCGFSTAVAMFASLNIGCGIAALFVERWLATPQPIPAGEPSTIKRTPGIIVYLVLTGLLGIGYEVLSVRVLGQVLENTFFTFVAVLTAFLLGTAAGGALDQLAARRFGSKPLLPGLLQALSVSSLLGVFVLLHADALARAARTWFPANLAGSVAAELVTAMCVFALPTLCMGALFSELVESARISRIGIGHAVAANTLGSALAPLVVGVLLLPTVGASWTFLLLALVYLVLAWSASSPSPRFPSRPQGRPVRQWRRLAVTALVAGGLGLLLPKELRFVDLPPKGKLLAYKEGATDAVAVIEHFDGNRSLLVNNRFTMGGTGAAPAERRHATIPLLLHPAPKRALFLGLGTGITFAGAAAEPNLRADGVELLPEVIEAFPWFAPQNSLPADPSRFRIYAADAHRFVRVCPDKYDVIVADLFHPARDGAGSLYTREHFQAIRERLTSGGLFCQWLPLFQLDQTTLRVIFRTFLEVFPNARAYLLRWTIDTPVLGLIAGVEPQLYPTDYFPARVQNSLLAEQLNAEQIRDAYHLFGCFLCGPEELRHLAGNAPVNTDDRPVVTFTAPALGWRPSEPPYGRLLWLLHSGSADPQGLFTAEVPSAFVARLSSFINARNVYLKGLVADDQGRVADARALFLESARLSDVFPTAYAQCVTLAMREAKVNPAAARALLEQLAAAQPKRPVAAQLLQRMFPSPPTP